MILLLIISLLLAGAAASYALARSRPLVAGLAGAGANILALLVWLAGGRALPVSLTLSAWPAAAGLSPWRWQADAVSAPLTTWLLLLSGAAALYAIWRPDVDRLAVVPLLTAAGLAALWPDSIPGLLSGWLLLEVAWVAALIAQVGGAGAPIRVLSYLGLPLAGLLALWLAAAQAGSSGLDLDRWPVEPVIWLVVAALAQIGAFTLSFQRTLARPTSVAASAVLPGVLAVAGLALLARLAANGPAMTGLALSATAIGLAGLVAAAALAWRNDESLGWALVLGQASLVLLATAWGGREAVLAEGRVLLLAAGLLLLLSQQPPDGIGHWHAAVAAVAVVALAGLPLTAGFNGRVLLHGAWLADGRYLLLVITLSLQAIVWAAALQWVWSKRPTSPAAPTPVAEVDGFDWQRVAYGLALALPALGLVAVPRPAGAPASVAVLLPVAAAVGLFRLRATGRVTWPRMAGKWRLPPGAIRPLTSAYPALSKGLRAAVEAIREATQILDGESGLLWLLLLIAVSWLARLA